MSRCPDCEYTDVRTVYDAHSTWMLTLPCERHAAAAPVLLPPVGVSARQAAQSLADAFRADAARISVARFVYSRTLDHGGCCPVRRPLVAWLRPHRLYFRGCRSACERRWCWDTGQWRKVLQPDEIRELEESVRA